MGSYRNWGELSWANLRKQYQRDCSEALCAWLSKSDESNFCLVGIKNISVEFAQMLEKEKPIVAFGPSDPPLEYLMNLIGTLIVLLPNKFLIMNNQKLITGIRRKLNLMRI